MSVILWAVVCFRSQFFIDYTSSANGIIIFYIYIDEKLSLGADEVFLIYQEKLYRSCTFCTEHMLKRKHNQNILLKEDFLGVVHILYWRLLLKRWKVGSPIVQLPTAWGFCHAAIQAYLTECLWHRLLLVFRTLHIKGFLGVGCRVGRY
jgi:hypothetical protein